MAIPSLTLTDACTLELRMPDKELLTAEAREQLGAAGPVELVVGVAAPDGAAPALAAAQEGLGRHAAGLRAVVIHAHPGGMGGMLPAPGGGAPVLDLPCRPPPGASGTAAWRVAAARAVLETCQGLQVRACVLLDAEVTSLAPEWVGRLLGPILEQDVDLVAPYYERHPFNGAINTGILYPLTRALTGRRLRFPAGGEFACSARLVGRVLASELWRARNGPDAVDPWLLASLTAPGWRCCQARLGPRTVATEAQTDLTGLLVEALSPVLADMQRSSAIWQKVRGSVAVELLGAAPAAEGDSATVEVRRLLDAFRLGQQNLREVWGMVLPPSTMVELKKLARMADAEFRLPDQIWARIIYDFALAYHQRLMSREHLMGALAPLYLGWFGSFATELGDAAPAQLEARVERLCLQFESEKPYLISRWRWPDRFNP